jgi:2-oxoisovalerate dehydrogenase E1 component
VLSADQLLQKNENTLTVVSYGMGVHWALNAAKSFEGKVEIVDLRTLHPLDMDTVIQSVQRNNRCLVITEEPVHNSFAQSIAARVQEACFEYLDAPVRTIGAENMPAIPLNETLEKTMIPSIEKVQKAIEDLLNY